MQTIIQWLKHGSDDARVGNCWGTVVQCYDEHGRFIGWKCELFDGTHAPLGWHPKQRNIAIDYAHRQLADLQNAASALGRLGGSKTSAAKKLSSAANGAKGGRPKKITDASDAST